ncbi:Acid protease [Rhizoctonia solani]|uniref:Acid protease n=1 Tax=Rhizoctonia solani TaxID=456999 RepID=A0A8H7LMM0_9AGAM|nr:Acid protease [Rhizoctonia solani]
MAAIEGTGGAGGIVLPMTMSGDGFTEAIYSIGVTVSSGATFEMQVDCGSSDAWLASSSCKSTVCQRAGTSLYGWSPTTVDSGAVTDFTYLVGSVQGNIVFENIRLGSYPIANQALLSASQIENERLTSNFVGLLGLALEYNSLFVDQFKDKLEFSVSTVATNLFSSPTSPSNRWVGISLERPGQSNSGIPSLLSIGRHPSKVVPDPSKIVYSPITDATHWRLPITEIAAWLVGSYNATTQAYNFNTRREVQLTSSVVSGSRSIWPLATIDTGGAHIISTRALANAFWGAFGIGPASDGMYYVPCNLPINVTFRIGGVEYAAHPLDMTYPDSYNPYVGNCIGSWQASDSLYSTDIVLGAAFMRNVYTVLQYDSPKTGVATGDYDPSTARPQLGLMSLTSWQTGLQDFYRVRILKESLESGSSGSSSGSSGGGGSSNGINGLPGTTEKSKKLSAGIIALIGILLFFGLSAGLFGARWWVMQRRWKRLRAAAQANEVDAEKDSVDGAGLAVPRPSRLNKDEEYERAHSAAYNRESVLWDDGATAVGSRTSRAKNRKPGKTHSFAGSRVGLMGEWVEPDSDEECESASRGLRNSNAPTSSSAGDNLTVRDSWATVRPRETGDIDVLERANRTMSLAGVGAGAGGTKVHFIGGSVDFGRPSSMPADILQAAGSPGGILGLQGSSQGGMHHRPTYSRDDSAGSIGMPLLAGGSRSPLGQMNFLPDQLVIPTNTHVDSRPATSQLVEEDDLARARPSVDVGLGPAADFANQLSLTMPPITEVPADPGEFTPVTRKSMDIASPTAYLDRRI